MPTRRRWCGRCAHWPMTAWPRTRAPTARCEPRSTASRTSLPGWPRRCRTSPTGPAMEWIDELLDLLDRGFARLTSQFGGLPSGIQRVVALPALLVALLAIGTVVVRWLIPWLARNVLRPGSFALTGVVTVVALTVDLILSQLFRLLSLPLTPVHYAVGDGTLAGSAAARRLTGSVVRRLGRLGRVRLSVLLVAVVALLIWWNSGY